MAEFIVAMDHLSGTNLAKNNGSSDNWFVHKFNTGKQTDHLSRQTIMVRDELP